MNEQVVLSSESVGRSVVRSRYYPIYGPTVYDRVDLGIHPVVVPPIYGSLHPTVHLGYGAVGQRFRGPVFALNRGRAGGCGRPALQAKRHERYDTRNGGKRSR